MDNLDNFLSNVAGESYDATLGNYDATLSTEQAYDAGEVENYLHTVKRKPKGVARAIADKAVRSPFALNKIKEAMRQDGYRGAFEPGAGVSGQGLEAQFDIHIKRNGATVASDLPVPIFGAFDIQSKYNGVLNFPAGVSISAIAIGAVGKEKLVTISYTDGTHTDTVDISIAQYDYPNFLTALTSAKFKISNARYGVADTSATGLQQMTKPFNSVVRSMFGALIQNNIPLASAKSPFQFQTGLVDIIGTFDVDAQTTWVLNYQANASQEVTISAFVTRVDKGVI